MTHHLIQNFHSEKLDHASLIWLFHEGWTIVRLNLGIKFLVKFMIWLLHGGWTIVHLNLVNKFVVKFIIWLLHGGWTIVRLILS